MPDVARRRRPAEVRALLVRAAGDVFARKGYAQTTTDDIAEEAGVAVSVMYRHFKNKSELFREAVLSPFVEFLSGFDATWRAQLDQPWEERRLMGALLSLFYDSLQEHRDAVLSLMAPDGRVDPEQAREAGELFQRMFEQLRLIGEAESASRGWFPPEDIELTIRLALGMVASMAVFDGFLPPGPGRPSRDALLEHMSDLVLYGLRRAPCPGETGRSVAASPVTEW